MSLTAPIIRILFGHVLYRILPQNGRKTSKMQAKVHSCPHLKHLFHRTNFQETQKPQRYCLEVFYAIFLPNRSTNMESGEGRNSLTTSNKHDSLHQFFKKKKKILETLCKKIANPNFMKIRQTIQTPLLRHRRT